MLLHPHTNRRSGMTLVEIAIVSVLLSVILGAVALFQSSNRDTLQQQAGMGVAQDRAHRALTRVLSELDAAAVTRLVPDPTGSHGSDDLVFQKSLGVDAAGAVIWSPQ